MQINNSKRKSTSTCTKLFKIHPKMASDLFKKKKKNQLIQLNKQELKSLIWNYYFCPYKAIFNAFESLFKTLSRRQVKNGKCQFIFSLHIFFLKFGHWRFKFCKLGGSYCTHGWKPCFPITIYLQMSSSQVLTQLTTTL